MNKKDLEILIDDYDNYLAEDNQEALTDHERWLLRDFMEWKEQL